MREHHDSCKSAQPHTPVTNGSVNGHRMLHHGSGKGGSTSQHTLESALAALGPIHGGWQGKTSPPTVRGLRNLGNSCFLNSILQALTHTAPLAQLCVDKLHSRSCVLTSTKQACAFCIIERHIVAALSTNDGGGLHDSGSGVGGDGHYNNHGGSSWYGYDKDAISPNEVICNLHLLARHFVHGRQEDAHELLRLSLEAMDKSCLYNCGRPLVGGMGTTPGPERPFPPTVIERIFQGKFQNQVKCLGCGYESNTYDPFLDMSLELPHVDSVDAALDLFTKEERLDGDNCYHCSHCKRLCPALKRLSVHEAPAVLVVHLKRFNVFGGKINRNVRFDEQLSLRGHMSRNAPEKHGPTYRLYAMVVHAGASVGSGHYYAFARKLARRVDVHHGEWHGHRHDRTRQHGDLGVGQLRKGCRGDLGEGGSSGCGTGDGWGSGNSGGDRHGGDRSGHDWHILDDSSVQPCSHQEVLTEQAYILFYERADGEGLPPHAVAPLSSWGDEALLREVCLPGPGNPLTAKGVGQGDSRLEDDDAKSAKRRKSNDRQNGGGALSFDLSKDDDDKNDISAVTMRVNEAAVIAVSNDNDGSCPVIGPQLPPKRYRRQVENGPDGVYVSFASQNTPIQQRGGSNRGDSVLVPLKTPTTLSRRTLSADAAVTAEPSERASAVDAMRVISATKSSASFCGPLQSAGAVVPATLSKVQLSGLSATPTPRRAVERFLKEGKVSMITEASDAVLRDLFAAYDDSDVDEDDEDDGDIGVANSADCTTGPHGIKKRKADEYEVGCFSGVAKAFGKAFNIKSKVARPNSERRGD